jgi:uncharacterized protein YdhG (YjbR/CyaY superfamily)
MAKTGYKTVDEYIAAQPEAVRGVLGRLRAALREALPAAEEVISYQIPAYKLHGKTVIFFAAWKEHYSLYPATGGVVPAFKDELAPYEVSKGTIRFPLSQPVPIRLVQGIARLRAKEVAELQKAKAAAKKRQPAGRAVPSGRAAPAARRGLKNSTRRPR